VSGDEDEERERGDSQDGHQECHGQAAHGAADAGQQSGVSAGAEAHAGER